MPWLRPDWPPPPGVVAFSTTRRGGHSPPPYDSLNLGDHVGDDPEAVAANREVLRRLLELPAEPLWLEQVHGSRVVDAACSSPSVRADGAFTARPGVVCAVLTADCLPVLLAASDGSKVAAVHAGWRGLAAGVLESAVECLDVPPAGLRAWLGPAIGPAAFEVGEEVRQAFLRHEARAGDAFHRNARGRWQADLYRLARQRLEAAGVREVHGGGLCTYSDPALFFSHRRDGTCGRMASLIWIRG